MGFSVSDDDDIISDINITPFVDIILVVLIIFMVTATTIVRSSIPVNLPDAVTAESNDSISIGLTLTREGNLLMDGESVSTEELIQALDEAKNTRQEITCLIAADKDVSHGRVVWLLDLLRTQGIARFAINVDKAQAVPLDPSMMKAPPGTVE